MVALGSGQRALYVRRDFSMLDRFVMLALPVFLPSIGIGFWLAFEIGLSAPQVAFATVVVWLAGLGIMYMLPTMVIVWANWVTTFVFLTVCLVHFGGLLSLAVIHLGLALFYDLDLPEVVSVEHRIFLFAILGIAVATAFWAYFYKRAGRETPKTFLKLPKNLPG